jgi:hypothetical protein
MSEISDLKTLIQELGSADLRDLAGLVGEGISLCNAMQRHHR